MKLASRTSTAKLFPMSLAVAALMAAIFLFPGNGFASGPAEAVIYSFQGGNTPDGESPSGGVVADRAGNLYGVTAGGGEFGFGTVFKLSPRSAPGGTWTESVIFNLDESIGSEPFGPLIFDQAGNLYGTTYFPGGSVFELSPPAQSGGSWTPTVIYTFNLVTGVNSPQAGVVFDRAGNIYGTASMGGAHCVNDGGCGGVFQLVKPKVPGGAWTQNVLYSFPGSNIQAFPGTHAGVTIDPKGALYGTSLPPFNRQSGTVFRLKPPKLPGGKWIHSVLYAFQGGSDGLNPYAGVTLDAQGNLYGTTSGGGSNSKCVGCGTVFELTPTPNGPWAESVLYRFQGGTDGSNPASNLILDRSGILYGTTLAGGNPSCGECGTVFQLAPPVNGGSWTKTILHDFVGGNDGNSPTGGLTFGMDGALYGETAVGGTGACGFGTGCGTVYSVTP